MFPTPTKLPPAESGRLFTPVQATRTLPLVRGIVADILEKGRELRRRTDHVPDAGPDEDLEELEGDILRLMGELDDIGCRYKDWNFEVGLVDFPARIEGEDVLLCWRSDESRVTHYHTPDAGFAGRRPIPDYLLAEGE